MKKLGAAVVCAALLCVCAGAVAGKATGGSAKIAWSKCYAKQGPFQCGTVQVPLDYDQPNGPTISLAVVRLPATDQAHRIGSLFLNPGGPGGSGVVYTVFAGPSLYTDEVRARFDLVGFDPRGVTQQHRRFGASAPTGSGARSSCRSRSRAIPPKSRCGWTPTSSSTRPAPSAAAASPTTWRPPNVARDMDVLRQAVGDSQLNYAGVSYGTILGQTYANMFPNKIRAMIIDGVLDPIAWTTGSVTARRSRSRRGSAATRVRRQR